MTRRLNNPVNKRHSSESIGQNTKMVKKCALPMEADRLRLTEAQKRRERIQLAIAKGKQTVLPRQTKSIKLSKFEHRSDEGPLVVFAEELAYPFGYFGKYQAVRKYQSGYDIGKAHTQRNSPPKKRNGSTYRNIMLNEKSPENIPNGLGEKVSEESTESSYDISKTQFRLPKLKLGQTTADVEDTTPKLEFSGKNTELPKLPAQEYIDNFRRDAADFERSLTGIGRGNAEKRLLKAKPREIDLLPRIDERGALFAANMDKHVVRDEHLRLPKLQQKREDSFAMESIKKKRKTKSNSETKKWDSKRSISHSERKAAAQREQAKWCKMTFQSNSYT